MAPMIMGIEATTARRQADLLRLAQWMSPAFPLGGFAYSHGLEGMIARGDVTDQASFASWLDATLTFGAGWCDAVLLALAHRAVLPLGELSDLARALAASPERLLETEAQGAAFANTTNALLGTDLALCPLPVAVGAQARHLSLDTATIGAFYLQSFAGNLTAVATRAIPLGQTEAQQVLAAQSDRLIDLARRASEAGPEDLVSSVLRSDLISMQHETQEVRLFRS